MADEKEKVIYEFYGDVSSLRSMTKEAIGLLDKFQNKMDAANSAGIVKASQRAQTGFQNSINKMIKSVTAVQKKLNSVGDIKMPRGTKAFDTSKAAADTLADTLTKLTFSNTITSKSLNEMKADLNKVTAGLKSAGPSFDTLISKEEKFQHRLESIGNVANQFSSKIQGATQKVQGTFSAMGTFVGSKLSAIGNKFEPLVAKIQGFKDRATIAGNRVAQVFMTVAAAFRRTSDGTEGASASQSKFGKVLDSIREKLNKQNRALKESAEGFDEMSDSADEALGATFSKASGATAALGAIKNVVSGVVDSFFALAGVDVGNILAKGAKSAIDYVENMNLFNVAMGSSIDKGNAFINKMQEVYGMDPSNLYRYTGYFYQLADAIGMNDGAAASMSLSMTKMSNDLASLFNTEIQTVVDNLSSGLQGMSRSVRKYGMDIRATTLQQTAFQYGLTEQVENMSEANRQALRFITMHNQAQNAINQTTQDLEGNNSAMGDFARNIETPANQLRILKEQISQLGRAIGNFIIAPIAKALPYINGFIMALRTLVNFVSTLLGVSVQAGSSLSSVGEGADDAASGVGAIGGAADKASKKLKQLIAPFDELNVLQESTGDSGSGGSLIADDALDPALAQALQDMELNLENISMKANKVRDSILGFLGLTVTTDPITGDQIIQWDKDALLANITSGLDKLKSWFEDLSPFAQFGVTFAGVFAVISGVSTLLGALPSILGILGAAFGFLTSPITIVTLALAALLTFSEDFRTAFVDLFSKVGESLQTWGSTLSDLFSTVGTDIKKMWQTHIQPTIAKIGDALAPALETLGSLWENLSTIIDDVFGQVKSVWTKVLKPAIEGALEIIQDLCELFQELWEEYVDPVVTYIGDGIEDLWTKTLKPIIDKIISIIGKLIELIMALWNNPLKPIVKWVIDILGPAFKGVFKQIWDVIKQVCDDIGDIIKGVLQVFEGLIDFLVGVFTGDWERALKGLVNIFVGIGNTIISVFETVINAVISLINGLVEAVWQGIQGAVNIILGAVEGIADFLGYDLNIRLNASVPNIPSLRIPRIPEMAKGGVVTGPTHLIAGEGKYDEAIIPLGDSPQMQDFIDKIVAAIDKDDDPKPQNIDVKVYIGDKEYDAYTYKASERGKKIVGKQPVKIGG